MDVNLLWHIWDHPLRNSQYAPVRASINSAYASDIVDAIRNSAQTDEGEPNDFSMTIDGHRINCYGYGGVIIQPPERSGDTIEVTFMSSGEDALESLHYYSKVLHDAVKRVDKNADIQWTTLPYVTCRD